MIDQAGGQSMSACFDEQLIVDLVAGDLAATALASVERHLATCDDCTELVARVAAHSPRRTSLTTKVAGASAGEQMNDLRRPRNELRDGPSPSLRSGTILRDTYRIVRHLEKGGMGEVYEASHARLSGRYAVKVLPPEFAANKTMLSRFRREAQIASGLQHPNIVQVIDFHETDEGRPYLVMEYLDGENLARLLARGGPLKLSEVLPIVLQIGAALGAVHRQGVVHRDIKPQNIFIIPQDDGTRLVKLLDFGISKGNAVTSVVTRQPALMGTPQYMAPEQALRRMEDIGPATDQFALAAITYEMLTGRAAFDGPLMPVVLYHIVHEPPPPMGANQNFQRVEPVLHRALSKDPGARFPSMADFTAALTAAATPVRSSEPERTRVSHDGAVAPARAGKRPVRPRFTVPLRVALIAVAALAMLFLVRRLGPRRDQPTGKPAAAAAMLLPAAGAPSARAVPPPAAAQPPSSSNPSVAPLPLPSPLPLPTTVVRHAVSRTPPTQRSAPPSKPTPTALKATPPSPSSALPPSPPPSLPPAASSSLPPAVVAPPAPRLIEEL